MINLTTLVRHIMQLRVGSGELYALCAPSDVCRNAWVQDIKRLKQTSVAPTIRMSLQRPQNLYF